MAEKQSQTENKMMVNTDELKVAASVVNALAAANKVDATLSHRLRERKRRPVQFLQHYARSPKINRIDPTVTEVEGYRVNQGQVRNLFEEEIARLVKWGEDNKDPLIETDPKKFKPLQKWRQQFNPVTRKGEWVKDGSEIPVDELIKSALDAG